ncbi:MAG: hypothetical protein KBC84_11390 [Proteobacteria bacterium]|nr:hypothetical protein [Pseudomonadota bacterium]
MYRYLLSFLFSSLIVPQVFASPSTTTPTGASPESGISDICPVCNCPTTTLPVVTTTTAIITTTSSTTSTTTQAACKYYTVDQYFLHDGDRIGDFGHNHGDAMFSAQSGNVNDLYGLSCIKNIFDRCSIPQGQIPRMDGFERLRDDCVFVEMAKIAGQDCGSFSSQQWNCIRDGSRCKHTPDPVKGSCREKHMIITFNNQCQAVSSAKPNEVCGRYGAMGIFTPISLIWNEKADIQAVFNAVEFRMNPHQSAKWQTWRASEQTPLLVLDPEHTGEITSGAQLFGSWTWGGKNFASLSDMITGGEKSEWESGYHALAQLDVNHNNKVDGQELAGLSLWFDKNQDAVSQQGEVVSVRELGIKSLYFNAEAFDTSTKSKQAKLGFEREVDGKIITGASVDWYGEIANSKFEMLQREQSKVILQRYNDAGFDQSKANEQNENSKYSSDTSTPPYAGPWKWQVQGDNPLGEGAVGQGLIYLAKGDSSEQVVGSSYIEVAIRDKHGIDQRAISRMAINGKFIEDANKIDFNIVDEKGIITESTAILSEDGKSLNGETTTKILKAEGNSEFTTVKYKWIATRY